MKTRILLLGLLVPLLPGHALADVTNDLVAYYPFDGNAEDATGNGNDGVVGGAILTSDRFGTADAAYAFPGTPQGKITVDSANLLLQPPFSFSVWVNFSGGSQDPLIFSEWGWEIQTVGAASTRMIDFNNSTDAGVYDCISSHSFPEGIWHHIVAVRSTNAMSLYVDGQLENSLTVTGPIAYAAGLGTIWMPTIGGGAGIGYPYDSYAGVIDDVRLYNRALTGQDVTELYTQELGVNLTVSYFPGVKLQLNTINGQNYQLQTSPDPASWSNWESPIVGDGQLWSKSYTIQNSNTFFSLGPPP